MKFLLDLPWVFNLQNCHSNPHCSHKLDSSVSQASFLKQKRWLALATSFPTQSGNSSGHGSFLRTAAHQSRQPIVLINVLTLKRVCDTFSQNAPQFWPLPHRFSSNSWTGRTCPLALLQNQKSSWIVSDNSETSWKILNYYLPFSTAKQTNCNTM